VAPNVEKILGRKVALKKDDGKNKLKIIARLAKHLRKRSLYEMVAAHQRPTKLTPPVGQADSTSFAANQSAKPTMLVRQANSPGSSSPNTFGSSVLRTFVPQRLETGTWKTNEKKKGRIMKKQCNFDRLMSKYKTDSENQSLKKGEPIPTKQDDKFKQLVVAQAVAPSQRVPPRVSRWGPPVSPPPHGVPMEFGCLILCQCPCFINAGGKSLLVIILDNQFVDEMWSAVHRGVCS
jgi:hypothetical protein